jgi:hypothetical protein
MPLAILAAANAAVSAIQQGCELYKEYKGTVTKAKKTLNEVKGIAKEVTGVWAFLKSKFFPDKNKPVDLIINEPVKKVKKRVEVEEIDELSITIDLINQLKIFFTCLSQLKEKLAESQAKSLEAINDGQLLGSAVDIEYAMVEIQKLQKQIRETMVYSSPKELGDLYTRVVERVGVIQEQQELERIKKQREVVQKKWRKEQLENQLKLELVSLLVTLVLIAWIWGLWITLIIRQ